MNCDRTLYLCSGISLVVSDLFTRIRVTTDDSTYVCVKQFDEAGSPVWVVAVGNPTEPVLKYPGEQCQT